MQSHLDRDAGRYPRMRWVRHAPRPRSRRDPLPAPAGERRPAPRPGAARVAVPTVAARHPRRVRARTSSGRTSTETRRRSARRSRAWASTQSPASSSPGTSGREINFGSTLYSLGAFDYFLVKFDANGLPVWAKGFGSANNDGATYPMQVAVAPNGHIVLAGAANGDIDFGGGALPPASGQVGFNVVVAEFDNQGNHLWSKRFTGSSKPHRHAGRLRPRRRRDPRRVVRGRAGPRRRPASEPSRHRANRLRRQARGRERQPGVEQGARRDADRRRRRAGHGRVR